MAILLSARAESDLLCLLQSHPLQPAGRHVGQGLQHRRQSLRYSLMCIHGRRSSEHGEFSLAAQPAARITACHSPTDRGVSRRRSAGFLCALAGCEWLRSVEFYRGSAPHPSRPSPPSHPNQRNHCCHVMFSHCHKREVDW